MRVPVKKSKTKNVKCSASVARRGRVNWWQEIRIAFFTSILFLVFTTLIFFLAHKYSPGEYTGDRLERFLKKEIRTELSLSCDIETPKFDKQLISYASNPTERDTIVVCGIYNRNIDYENGRFVAIWERGVHSFWNELLGTETRYELSFLRAYEDEDLSSYTLNCQECFWEDSNDDGKQDIHIRYGSKFADRNSTADVFILNTNDGWKFVTPDLSIIENEIKKELSEHSFPFLEIFEFTNPKNAQEKQAVYSLSLYGTMQKFENPIWGGKDYLYMVAVNNNVSVLSSNHCALAMMRFSKSGELKLDPNWNDGKVLIVSRDEITSTGFIEKRWGVQTEDGIIFYKNDLE